ncbi:hypothetical protein EAF04_001375 [Stromatinia cepivora]|nr:hypothetical protein EAF04_001375 [Stromatinia cepivora]
MLRLRQNTMDAISAAVDVEDNNPQMQEIEEGLGHILQYHLKATHINYGSVNLNRMAFRVFQDSFLHFELKTAILQMARERDEGLTGDDNAIDLRQDEEMINLTGDEDVIDLTGDEVVDLTQHEDLTHFRSVRSAPYGPPPPYSP